MNFYNKPLLLWWPEESQSPRGRAKGTPKQTQEAGVCAVGLGGVLVREFKVPIWGDQIDPTTSKAADFNLGTILSSLQIF